MNKVSIIKKHLLKNDYLTLDEAIHLIGRKGVINPRQRVTGDLSSMIKQGMLRRVRNGIYTAKSHPATPHEELRSKCKEQSSVHSAGGAEDAPDAPLVALARRYKELRDQRLSAPVGPLRRSQSP